MYIYISLSLYIYIYIYIQNRCRRLCGGARADGGAISFSNPTESSHTERQLRRWGEVRIWVFGDSG